MKHLLLISTMLLCSMLSSCGDTNDFDLDEEPLSGMIAGDDWSYRVGNVYYEYSSGYATAKVLNIDMQNPCAAVLPSTPHLELTFPSQLGTFDLTSGSFTTGNFGKAIFKQFSPSQSLEAFGFVQIVSISSTEIIGYLNAQYDDDNLAKGSFVLMICN